jgi:hypothetical protein
VQDPKKPKSKEELAQLRKAMMKRKQSAAPTVQKEAEILSPQPSKLMERLATGKKPEMDKKEMKRLTEKNF